jgi:hypothetical protein
MVAVDTGAQLANREHVKHAGIEFEVVRDIRAEQGWIKMAEVLSAGDDRWTIALSGILQVTMIAPHSSCRR